jgi:transcriptional repressor NrdR
MKCPFCKKGKTEVVNSRTTKGGTSVWRRRTCPSCQGVFSTYETPSLDFLIIKKRSGKHTRYAPHKILASIFDACAQGKGVDGRMRDRGDAAGAAKKLLEQIEQNILASGKTILSTKELVRLVGAELESVDHAAFYRYGAFSPHKQETLGL